MLISGRHIDTEVKEIQSSFTAGQILNTREDSSKIKNGLLVGRALDYA